VRYDESSRYSLRKISGDKVTEQAPLHFVFYFAATPERVWDGFVSPESNRIIFAGSDFQADLNPGGFMRWTGPGPDGEVTAYASGEVLRCEPPKLLQYTFSLGRSETTSRVTLELVPETEATKVSVTQDGWAENDPGYAACEDGWPRILSRLKTLIETGKTFKPH
jgi:uncharacterized protein YndB with AHSA1/START domain